MTRVLRLLAALAVLAALLGAENSGCDNQPRQPPKPKTTASPTTHTVHIRAHSKGPYSLMLIVNNPETGGLIKRVGPEHVAGGEFTEQVQYDSGQVVGVYLVMWGNAADLMECSIADGPRVDRPKPRRKETMCLLLTSR